MKLLFLGAGDTKDCCPQRTINDFEFEQPPVKLREMTQI